MSATPLQITGLAGKILLWFIWVAILCGVISYQVFLGNEHRTLATFAFPDDSFALGALLLPLIISVGIRWFLIPFLRHPLLVLIPFILGIAIAESLSFYGLFLFAGQYNSIFFYASLLAVLQFCPYFIGGKHAPSAMKGLLPPL